MSLTAAQREAVEHGTGPLLTLAGPGSGKTRVVTHRIARLVQQGVHPQLIIALTFTNKAADEMKSRVQQLVPEASVWIGTFHRFCSRLLRRHAAMVGLDNNFTIYDSLDSKQAIKRAVARLADPPAMTSVDTIANQISWLKNHLVTPDDIQPGRADVSPLIADAYRAYTSELLQSNAVDFDDLLLHTVSLLRQSDELRASLDEAFQFIMVDEYQDTNLAQYAIVRALSIDHPNLAVTGDPDQSIYGWRGANLRNIMEFENDYPDVRVVRLEQNYRSTPSILRAAQALISNNQYRKRKELFTEKAEGPPVRLAVYPTAREEAESIVADMAAQIQSGAAKPGDFAVLYRVNALSRGFEHQLRGASIPFQIVNGVEFYQRKEVKDVIAYLQVLNNPRDNGPLARIINVPARGIGRTTLQRLTDYATQQGIPLLEAARVVHRIETIGKQAKTRVGNFVALLDRLAQHATTSVQQMIGFVLTETKYRDVLADSEFAEERDRAANVDELLAAAKEFDEMPHDDPLGEFLEQASLVNDTDALDESNQRVTLMTMHSAKGLEYPQVFIVGVEQGLIPHERSFTDQAEIEEERRLLFVGMTRAMQRLQLSRVIHRLHNGVTRHSIPSHFLMELPRDEMEQVSSVVLAPSDRDTSYDDDGNRIIDVNDWDDVPPTSENDATSENEATAQTNAAQTGEASQADAAGGSGRPRDDAPAAAGLSLQTASQMMSETETAATTPQEPIDPDAIQVGMTVVHPDYGPGKVAAVSGKGRARTGTINFAAAGEKHIVLAFSPLTIK